MCVLLTDKVERLLEVLLDVLVRRIGGRNLFVRQADAIVRRRGRLAGNVQNAVGADIDRIGGIAAVAQQQVRKDGRGGKGFDI